MGRGYVRDRTTQVLSAGGAVGSAGAADIAPSPQEPVIPSPRGGCRSPAQDRGKKPEDGGAAGSVIGNGFFVEKPQVVGAEKHPDRDLASVTDTGLIALAGLAATFGGWNG